MRIVIVGGGASGVVCAIHAKRENNQVILLEKNDQLLKKILLTGNGRCNYFHDSYRKEDYHSENLEYYDEIITDQNISDAKYFFDSIGVIPKNKNGYIYPFTGQASTLRDALLKELEYKDVEVRYQAEVLSIDKKNDQFVIELKDEKILCDRLVLATGGSSYPKTGSNGCGYSFLEKFHHTIIEPLPGLVQLTSNFRYLKEWDGVRADVSLSLEEDQEEVAWEDGEVQLTDYGISGICTFNLSHFVTRGLALSKKEVIHINFVPFMESLITPWMDRYSKKNPNKNISELLEGFLNKKLIPIFLKISHIRDDVYYEELTNDEKLTLCKNLKGLPIEITGTKDFSCAQITNGGVSLKEVDMKTMESNIVPRLYILGELLDLNGNCGGFNLTLCWISGILAGRSLGDEHD